MERISALSARERAAAVLDSGSLRELLADGSPSPHLAAQGIAPQADDGMVVARGTIGGVAALAVVCDGRFQGGSIGQAGGAKAAGALELALREARSGRPIRVVLLLESGGIRLQEANLGLLAIAEIHAAVAALRRLVPVVGVVTGPVGCFGGMAIAAGLCGALVITPRGRLGLNGPAVIEQEAGVAELDSADRELIRRTIGGERRVAAGLADRLVSDQVSAVRAAVRELCDAHPALSVTPGPVALRPPGGSASAGNDGRAGVWIEALSGVTARAYRVPSVVVADAGARYVGIVPDPGSRWPRARGGEAGLDEGWALAEAVREVVAADAGQPDKRPVVAVVDVPSQAYGYQEELLGLHQSLAAAVDAYAGARLAGHPVVALVVGKAISGGFLAHGLQANRILALDDPGVMVQAMSRESTARITGRSVAEATALAERFPATAYDIRSFATLGALSGLVPAGDPDAVRAALDTAIRAAARGPRDLSVRLTAGRPASVGIRNRLAAEWDA